MTKKKSLLKRLEKEITLERVIEFLGYVVIPIVVVVMTRRQDDDFFSRSK
jgi:hypothetical protein